jgi:hypothetical protein
MQSEKKRDPCESQTAKEITNSYLKSIAKRNQYKKRRTG